MTTRCAVLGSPIAHSLSPVLHRAAYRELGLDWRYERFEVTEDTLPDFVAGLDRDWRGLSLTKPLKAAALALGRSDELVELAGAANTVIIEPDGDRRLFNTDIGGLTDALRAAGLGTLGQVVISGAGGTARAALVSITQLGADRVTVLARRPDQVAGLRPLTGQLGVELVAADWSADVPPADLLISTVAASAASTLLPALDRVGAVFDALYDPWPTELAAAAEQRGLRVINGLDLLAHQAVRQVELMTGRSVSPELLLSAGRKALRSPDPA